MLWAFELTDGTWGEWAGAAASFLVAVVAMAVASRDRRERSRKANVRVKLREPFDMGNGQWHIRAEVTNRSKRHPCALRASVTETAGVASTGPEAPWPIPWRHTRDRVMTLPPRGTEFLLIGRVGADLGSIIVWVHEYDGESPMGHKASSTPPITLTVTVIEAVRGRIAAQHRLTLPLAGADDVPPAATLTKVKKRRRR